MNLPPHLPPARLERSRRRHRRLAATGIAASLVLLGACSSDSDSGMADTTTPPSGATGGGAAQAFEGTLADSVSPESTAISYDDAAPVGATMEATVTPAEDETTFALAVEGLEPDRGYAVHAHTMPCGATGDAAGPHFQDEKDPAATEAEPSSDPEYANPDNEVWLDLQTDADGAGTGEVTVPFAFDGAAPKSIVIHADMETMTAAGMAGMAGDRIACLDAPIE